MPKPGYISITLKQDVAKLLKAKAESESIGINELLFKLLSEDRPRTIKRSRLIIYMSFTSMEKPVEVDRAGFEPATTRVQTGYSYQAELPAHCC